MENSDKKEGFKKEHPILFNLILMAVVLAAVIYGVLWSIDIFTEHGKYKVVPVVKNLPLRDAINKLESEGFKWEITDSIYNDKLAPGVVIEQNPKANARVKSSRTIYIGINALMPRMITFPVVNDISVRQAQAKLEALGLRNVRIETISSPFKGLVINSKINGLSIKPGTKIAASSYITLVVGDGEENIERPDSVVIESSGETPVSDNPDESSSGVDFMQ